MPLVVRSFLLFWSFPVVIIRHLLVRWKTCKFIIFRVFGSFLISFVRENTQLRCKLIGFSVRQFENLTISVQLSGSTSESDLRNWTCARHKVSNIIDRVETGGVGVVFTVCTSRSAWVDYWCSNAFRFYQNRNQSLFVLVFYPLLPVLVHFQCTIGRMKPTMSNVNDTNVYLCNFRVSVDGDWLCLKELHDLQTCQFPPARAMFLRQDYGILH